MATDKGQARLRLVGADGELEELRRYAQSASGHRDSQRTLPPDSLSISIDNASAQDREPYATLLRWPTLVPQRSAKDFRSVTDMSSQNSLNSMRTYHHTVISDATPIGEFTNRCSLSMLMRMKRATDMADIRRENLRRYVNLRLDGNVSELNRRYRDGKGASSFFNDLLAGRKSFGEKLARQIERDMELVPSSLDIPDSPLNDDKGISDAVDDQLRAMLTELTPAEKRQLMGYGSALREARTRKKAS